jgi:voltage-gated potassium channel
MFFMSVLFLVVLAGLIHRYPHLHQDSIEAYLIESALGGLWLIFLIEAAMRYRLRDRSRRTWKPRLAAVACALLPPLRMGCRSQVRADQIWLPRLGWQPIDGHLRRTLEQVFSVPMIVFALMVLPLLALEFYESDKIRAQPLLALWVDIGTSVICLAFAVELILMLAVSDRPWRYCLFHWIDVAIVLLPAIDMLPAFRLLRLGRVFRLEQLLRWGRLQRLQALATRGWRAFLLLQLIQRLGGHSLERRRKKLGDLLHAKEEEVAELRREIQELDERIAKQAICQPPATGPVKVERFGAGAAS